MKINYSRYLSYKKIYSIENQLEEGGGNWLLLDPVHGGAWKSDPPP